MLSSDIKSIALLVHQHTRTGNVDITTHEIQTLKQQSQFTLGAGRVFSAADKESLMSILRDDSETDDNIKLIPETLLVNTKSLLCWYTKPQMIDVNFVDGESRSDRTGPLNVPVPGLVFILADGQPLRVFSFKGNSRPATDTKMFYAPFGNVYSDGHLCSGNVTLPTEISQASIPAFEDFVLRSTNTHGGDVSVIKGGGYDELVELYKTLSAKQAKRFPANKMAPVRFRGVQESTLANWLSYHVEA